MHDVKEKSNIKNKKTKACDPIESTYRVTNSVIKHVESNRLIPGLRQADSITISDRLGA